MYPDAASRMYVFVASFASGKGSFSSTLRTAFSSSAAMKAFISSRSGGASNPRCSARTRLSRPIALPDLQQSLLQLLQNMGADLRIARALRIVSLVVAHSLNSMAGTIAHRLTLVERNSFPRFRQGS